MDRVDHNKYQIQIPPLFKIDASRKRTCLVFCFICVDSGEPSFMSDASGLTAQTFLIQQCPHLQKELHRTSCPSRLGSGGETTHIFLTICSVRRSSPRTAKRPRTRPDWTDLGLDRSPGPASVLNGPVLVLNFSGKLRTSPGPVLCPYSIGVVTSHDQALNLVIIPLNPVTTLFN